MSDSQDMQSKPEDMLLRVMRVADILAQASGNPTHVKTMFESSDETDFMESQKTQM